MNPSTSQRVRQHTRAIDRCNQRGGRMLSLIDLIDAGTLDLPAAAYLAAMMRSGASLLVGANPGSAGKTTIMAALLNLLPDHTTIKAVDSQTVLRTALADADYGATCYVAHEISPARYYAYIWDSEARLFFRLGAEGHIIASNLHADTLEETREQLCSENGVEPAHLAAVTLKLYIRMDRCRWDVDRRVSHVYEGDGQEDRLIWTSDSPGAFTRHELESAVVSPTDEETYIRFLESLRTRGIRRIEDVRRALLQRA